MQSVSYQRCNYNQPGTESIEATFDHPEGTRTGRVHVRACVWKQFDPCNCTTTYVPNSSTVSAADIYRSDWGWLGLWPLRARANLDRERHRPLVRDGGRGVMP